MNLKFHLLFASAGVLLSAMSFAMPIERPSAMVCVSRTPRYAGGNFAIDVEITSTDSEPANYIRHGLTTSHGMDSAKLQVSIRGEASVHRQLDVIELVVDENADAPSESLKISTEKNGSGAMVYYLAEREREGASEKLLCFPGNYQRLLRQVGGVFYSVLGLPL